MYQESCLPGEINKYLHCFLFRFSQDELWRTWINMLYFEADVLVSLCFVIIRMCSKVIYLVTVSTASFNTRLLLIP